MCVRNGLWHGRFVCCSGCWIVEDAVMRMSKMIMYLFIWGSYHMLCYWAKTPLDYIQSECAMCYMRDISMPDYPANSEGKCHISPAENVVIRPQKMPTILWVSLILYFSVWSRYYRHYASLPKNRNEFCSAIQCMAYSANNITQRNQLNTASILPSSEIQIILNPHWMDEAHSFSFSARWNIRVYSQLVRKRPTNDYIPIPNACIYGMFMAAKITYENVF